MEINTFLSDFSSIFEETNTLNLTLNTDFRSCAEWGSLMAMAVIAMVDIKYNVQINGNDLRNCKTIEDIYNIVQSRK